MEQPANTKKTRILLIYAVTIIFWFDGRMAFFSFSYHGESACDGIEGTLKYLAKLSSLQRQQ
jgi:hypothetical protein